MIGERWRPLAGQAGRFVLVGVANTAVQQAVYLALLWAGVPYVAAHVSSWLVAICFSFMANCRFTYRVPFTWRRFVLFPLSALPGFVFSTVGTVVLVQWLGVPEEAASFLASVAAVPASFVIARLILLSGHHPVEVTQETLRAAESEAMPAAPPERPTPPD